MTDVNGRSQELETQAETGAEVEQPDKQIPISESENYKEEMIFKVLSWFVTTLVPVVLVLTSVRLVMTPVFVYLEYHTPNFPADTYGFTRQDRLYWSRFALDYLLNDEGIEYLGDLQFPNGSPVYNERELKHMEDVKYVAQDALVVWYLTLGVTLILGMWAWFGGWWRNFSQGLGRGGWLTLILVGVTILIVLIGFGLFFVFFHDVFFDPGTWRFAFSDTLIRLFPERFWRDTFLAVGLLTGVGGLALVMIFRRTPSD
jgi:integral membrane protein (TIGR01906 family)